MSIELLNMDCMARAGRKHSPETRRKIGEANKGKLLGIKRSPELVERSAKNNRRGANFNCEVCEAQFWRQPSAIKKGQNRFCSRECYQAWQKGRPKSDAFKEFCRTRVGEKSPTWKGGVTPEHMRIRNSKAMADWRQIVFERDNYQCQRCGARCGGGVGVHLHAHHIKSFADYPGHRFDPANGLTLCKECHYEVHSNG